MSHCCKNDADCFAFNHGECNPYACKREYDMKDEVIIIYESNECKSPKK
jgi:hypothetical protein